MIPESTLQHVMDNANIVDIVSEYLNLERKGDRYWGCCPFHNEKTPSFSVTQDKNLFYCFGCHKGGSLFNFVMEIEGLPFIEAVKLVAEKSGITIETDQQEQDAQYKQKQALKELYSRVSKSFNYILWNTDEGKKALDYLHTRSFSDESIRNFNIGYSPSDKRWLYSFLKGKGYSDSFLHITGLFSKRHTGYPLFSGRVMIPITSLKGDIIAFGGRILEGDGPKYINSPDTLIYSKREHLFAMHQSVKEIRTQRNFLICEGYFDALAFHQAGINIAVAPLGTALTPEQMRLLKRYSDSGSLVFDSDDAGINATKKTVILAETMGMKIQIVPITKGKDPGEILEKESAEALHKIIKYPINSFDYLLNISIDIMDTSTPDGKENVVRNMLPFIRSVESSVRREEYTRILSEKIDVSLESISDEISRQPKERLQNRTLPNNSDTHSNADFNTPEMFLIIGVLASPALFSTVRRIVSLEDIVQPLGKKLFMAMEECFRRENLSLEAVLEFVEEEHVRSSIIKRIASGEFSQHTEELVRDAAVKVKYIALEQRRAKVEKKLAVNENKDRINEILSEIMYLDGELDKLRLRQNDRSSE